MLKRGAHRGFELSDGLLKSLADLWNIGVEDAVKAGRSRTRPEKTSDVANLLPVGMKQDHDLGRSIFQGETIGSCHASKGIQHNGRLHDEDSLMAVCFEENHAF